MASLSPASRMRKCGARVAPVNSVARAAQVAYRVEISATLDIFLELVFLMDILINFFPCYYNLGGSRLPVTEL